MPRRNVSVSYTRAQPITPLPYLAVGTTYALLLVAALRPWTDPMSGLALGALLVTALVVIRQLLTLRENVRLRAEAAARQNEARFRSLVQHSSDVIIVTRPDAAVRFVSPSAASSASVRCNRLEGGRGSRSATAGSWKRSLARLRATRPGPRSWPAYLREGRPPRRGAC